MKLMIFLVFIISFNVFAETKAKMAICSLWYVSDVKKIVEKHGDFDKFKHCAISCLLSLRCPANDVMEIGIYKELADLVGPGNADLKDLAADFEGINLVMTGKAKKDNQCIKQCHAIYPENSCP